MPRSIGLGVRLEKGVPPGEVGREEPGWDAGRIRRLGADAVKLLVDMDVDDVPFTEAQLDLARRTAEACEVHDIALITEGLTFPRPGEDQHSARFRERRTANIFACAELLGPWTPCPLCASVRAGAQPRRCGGLAAGKPQPKSRADAAPFREAVGLLGT